MTMERSSKVERNEQEIVKRLKASGLRLRCDRVASRLLDDVKTAMGKTLPANRSIVFTITAPIKLPAKTSAALQEWLQALGVPGSGTTIYGNEVRARVLDGTAICMPRVIGFVHNPEVDAALVLELAETSLREKP